MYKFSDDFKKELLLQKVMKSNAEIHIIKRGPEMSIKFDGTMTEMSYMMAESLAKLCADIIKKEEGVEKGMDMLDKIYEFARKKMLKGDTDESK